MPSISMVHLSNSVLLYLENFFSVGMQYPQAIPEQQENFHNLLIMVISLSLIGKVANLEYFFKLEMC